MTFLSSTLQSLLKSDKKGWFMTFLFFEKPPKSNWKIVVSVIFYPICCVELINVIQMWQNHRNKITRKLGAGQIFPLIMLKKCLKSQRAKQFFCDNMVKFCGICMRRWDQFHVLQHEHVLLYNMPKGALQQTIP